MDSDSDYNPQTFEKKVNRSKPKQKRVRFSTEMKIRMIQLYERRPCLWDTKHLDYWNRIERSKAEKEIAALLKHPEALVNARWQVLRNEFRIERNRVLNGRETNKPYESKWPFYHHLEFLNNHSNRPYKLNKRRSPTQMVGYGVSVKRDVNEDAYGQRNGRTTPISIDSKLSLADEKNAQTAAMVPGKVGVATYSNACTYATDKRPRISNAEQTVAHCLEIIDELSKKIRPVDPDDDVRVFSEFIGCQLRQIKSKSCRSKCVHGIQRALMDWQTKDEELINQLQPQEEWEIHEEPEMAAVNVDSAPSNESMQANDATDANVIDPLDGQLASLGFDV